MAHLDVVPVDEDAPWQHPPFGADIVDGADLGARHPRRQGLPGRHLRGRRTPPGAGLHPRPGRLALVRLPTRRSAARRPRRRGRGARYAAAYARGSSSTRAAPSRTRRSRASTPPVAVIGVTEKGTTTLELTRRRPRRARLDAGADGRRPPGWPAPSCGSRSTRSRPARRRPTLELMRADRAARAAAAPAADGERLAGPPAAHPRPDRRRPRVRGDDPHHRRGDHALRARPPTT